MPCGLGSSLLTRLSGKRVDVKLERVGRPLPGGPESTGQLRADFGQTEKVSAHIYLKDEIGRTLKVFYFVKFDMLTTLFVSTEKFLPWGLKVLSCPRPANFLRLS